MYKYISVCQWIKHTHKQIIIEHLLVLNYSWEDLFNNTSKIILSTLIVFSINVSSLISWT